MRSRHQRRRGRVWRVLGWGILGLLVIALVASGGGYLALRTSLPAIDGRIMVAGLHGEVSIARDADGVPTITAKDDDDLAFGLGYAHAQDRLFQMELQRRYGAGRLAEIFGQAALPIDTQMRVLGLYRAAEAAFPKLSPEVQRGIEAYCAGVNAYLATRGALLPPEFLMLRFSPEPWTPADTLVWGKLMDFQLGGNYRGELLRARLAKTVSNEDMEFLYPDYPKDAPRTLAALTPLYRQLPLGRLYAALPEAMGPHFASNNWVVDGAHSASGKPLLANDPHLGFSTPGFWYLARLKTPERDIEGGTVAGTPFVIIGHNDKIAWGFTTTTADIEDLFIEKLDANDPSHRYQVADATLPFRVRQETIKVRGSAPVTLTVRATRHGPVVSDMLPPGTIDTGYVLALQATFLDDDDKSAEALWDIDRATDWTSFRESLKNLVGPPQNIVYADTGGTIGFIAAGRIPIRKTGDGWLPVPGWSGDYDWQGYIPFDQLPQGANPASGHFVSANNKIVPDSYPYFISRDWDLPDRAERIEALLEATPKQSPEASAAIQADTLSLEAKRLVPLMTKTVPSNDIAREAVARLQNWDFHMDADKVEPLLFTAWLRAFARSVLTSRLGDVAADYWDLKPEVMFNVLTQRPDWCAEPNKPGETCATRLSRALDTALDELRHSYGDEMAQWQWGRSHIAYFPNAVFERVPLLRDWLRVTIPTPGGYDTVNRGPSTIRDDVHPYEQRFGAGLRIITDMAALEESRMMIAPGQSGNPLSRHYTDLLARWRAFDWLAPSHGTPAASLILAPAP